MTKSVARLTTALLVSLVTAVVVWNRDLHTWWLLLALWPVYILLAGSIVSLLRKSRNAKQLERSGEWPETRGTVTTSLLKLAHVEVRCKYSASGTEYIGKYEINLTPFVPSRDLSSLARLGAEAKLAMADYPTGASLMIRYNPKNPTESVIFGRSEGSRPNG
jgi:hypothetical protein